jgi:peptide/nickel transport system substrate-binding protein
MMTRWLVVFTVTVLLVSACSGPGPTPTAPAGGSGAATPGAVTQAPAKKGGTFIDVSYADAPTMQPVLAADSASTDRIAVMFDGLRTQDPKTLEYKPNLAESWKFGADNLSMTYILRDNLVWSDGQPLTSADYKFTWDLLFDPNTKLQYRSLLANIVGSPDTPDAKTLVFKFKQVSAASTLYTDSWPAIPQHIFQGKDINDNPLNRDNTVGSGPFFLKEWAKDDHATFVANDKYFKGRPNLDQYIFRVVKDQNAAYQALKTGEADTSPINQPDWDEATKLPNVNALNYYYFASSWDYIGFNLRSPFFQDKRVRQAITSALNKPQMIERVLLGHAKDQNSVFPATSPVFTDDVPKFPYDVNKSKQLLKDAGWSPGSDGILVKDGKPFKVRMHYNAGNKRRESISTIAQQQLKEVGIQVEVIAEDFGAYVTRLSETKDFDMFLLGWVGGSDPDSSKSIWMTDGGQNYGGYSNADVDKWFPQADKVLDMQKERKPIYVQIQKQIAEDQPYVFLWTLEALRGFNKRIVGPQAVPLGTTETKWNVNEWYSTTGK